METLDFVPLVTYEYKLTFCQAIRDLPNDIKEKIYKQTLYTTDFRPTTPPPAPERRITTSRKIIEALKAKRRLF